MTEQMFNHLKPRKIVPRSTGMPVALTESQTQCRVIELNGQTCDLFPVDPVEWPLFRQNLPMIEL
jgi:hypothetical protein